MVLVLGTALASLASGDDVSLLATWDLSGDTTFLAAATGPGTLQITNTCVWLDTNSEDGRATLLVWPEPTSWNAEKGEITFVNYQGDVTILRDGDVTTVGGASSTRDSTFVRAP